MKAKRILSILLAGLMVAGMSVSAFANGTDTKTDDSTPPTQETPTEAPEGDYSVMPLGTPDGTAPTLVSVSMDKSKVSPGGTIEAKLNVSDDVSCVDRVYIVVTNEINNRNINKIFYLDEQVVNGTISITLTVS